MTDTSSSAAIADWFMDDTPSTSFPIYTRGNTGEVFPDPISPLTADFTWQGPGDEGLRDWMGGYSLELEELDPGQKVMFEIFGAYVFLNLSVARLSGARTPGMTPEQVDMAYFGTDSSLPPHVPRAADDDPVIQARCGAKMYSFLTATDFPEVDRQRSQAEEVVAARPRLADLDPAQLVARMREMKPWFRRIFEVHGQVSMGAGVVLGALTQLAMGMGRPGLDMRVAGGLGGVDSAEPSWVMWDLGRLVAASEPLTKAFDAGVTGLPERLDALGEPAAAFLAGFADFQRRFGSRGPNEWELRSDTWGTKAELALAMIDRMRLTPGSGAPQGRHEEARTRAEDALIEFRTLCAVDPQAAATLEMAITAASVFLPGRERSKTTIVKIVHETRLAARELGRKLAAAGHLSQARHVFMLRDGELDAAVAGPSFAEEAARREAHYLQFAELEPPFVFVGEPPAVSTWPRKGAATRTVAAVGTVLRGIGGSAGSATGRAKIITDPSEPADFEPGDILIAPITDPSWTPLFVPAAAVVVDVGGSVSHAVIVSRELGIPCVVSVTGATASIPTGALVRVDGDAGTVTILAHP